MTGQTKSALLSEAERRLRRLSLERLRAANDFIWRSERVWMQPRNF